LALTPGTRLGVYEVTAQIGEGGMGQVYRATDTKLKRQVAIKILPPSLARSQMMPTGWRAFSAKPKSSPP
jgi:serine/threonine protein kinase